jgi:hypothetical protein
VLSRDEVVELMRVFLPEGSNEARLIDQIDFHLGKVVELGFLRRLKPASPASGDDGRGAANPQGLRRCAVAGRVRPAAGGYRALLAGQLYHPDRPSRHPRKPPGRTPKVRR